MLTNYLKLAWRNLLFHRFYSLINIVGLAVGITFAALIGAYVWTEYQVNTDLRHAPRQYLVQSRWTDANQGMPLTTLAPMGAALRANYPALVANYYRFHGVNATISRGTNHFRESIQIGDSTLLTMFGFDLLHGDPRTALIAPNAIVITADKALKYFGKTDVLNQSLTVETPQAGKREYLVTGVLNALPNNSVSHLLTEVNEVFMSAGSLASFGADFTVWANPYIVTYVELQPGVLPGQLQGPLAQLIRTNTPPETQKNLTAYLTPLTDYYRQSNNGLVAQLIVTLLAVAGFILLMAVVNFVNLSLGSSSTRLREIGVRKALGSLRWQLTVQFLLEALVLTAIATGLSLVLYGLFRPLFIDVVGKAIPPLWGLPWLFFAGLLGLILLVGMLAGGYPALYLSAYSSVDSLKGKLRSVREGSLFRQVLITGQFAVAIVVFVGAVIVSRQIAFFFTSDLGFTKESVLTISSLPRDWSSAGVTRMQAVRAELARLPGVESASLSFEIPNGNVGNSVNVYRPGQDSTGAVGMKSMTTDESFAATYGIKMLTGRYFNPAGMPQDSGGIVLNQTAVRLLGYPTPAAAVDQSVRVYGSPRLFRILGVVADFHVGTLHEAIGPVAVGHTQNLPIYRFFSFRLSPGNPRATIAALERTWRARFPDAPFDYAFMDQTLQRLYQSELQLEQAAYLATGLALFIMLLGVVGLVSLSVARRTKELGVRKVLGASVPNLVSLFLREYVWVILLANALAWPLAYWLLSGWLATYAYHAQLTASPFALVGISLTLLTSMVVALQVAKAALTNPIKALRSE
ncbi:ABC transporter permease [Fibrella sp. HMF5335]|uniref:ABC transporter permease n=1 Tax=Fibrella rubiginis TaxID=2817060 RepID=A0A939K1T2_9BACT|nr:ABC transporter permease [Fibrella rubiginis]MBO0937477.1 ABC transporter permease [Fibrella rubiginis]